MTPEEELALLIEEQAKDDVPYLYPERHVAFSLDAVVEGFDGGRATFGDAVGVMPDGEVICFLPRKRGRTLGSGIHGTDSGYTNHRCRCSQCRQAHARVRRESYRKLAVRQAICLHCDSTFETSIPQKMYCTRACSLKAWAVAHNRDGSLRVGTELALASSQEFSG